MQKSDSIANLAAALAKLQADLRGAEKNASNPHFRSDFANLESVWDSIRAGLSKNGLSVSQVMGVNVGDPILTTVLMHSSGEWLSGEQMLMPLKMDPQSIGSAITYARRYGLAAIVGQIQTDDDGEESHGRGNNADESKQPPSGAKQSTNAPATKSPSKATMCCGKPMKVSKYNPNELYCFECKSKQPVVG